MDLVEKIEAARFLGREFLLWLWFECEVLEGTVAVPGVGMLGLSFEKQLVLTQEPESCAVKAPEPMREAESHEALRQGKLPTLARLRLLHGERDFAFRFAADARSLSGITLPNTVKDDVEQQFYDRMYSVEELETVVDALYRVFLLLRLSQAWSQVVAPAMRAWIRGESVPVAEYRAARKKFSKHGVSKHEVSGNAEKPRAKTAT